MNDNFTTLTKRLDSLNARLDAICARARGDATATAEEEKRWKIVGRYKDRPTKLEFYVNAFDYSEAKKKAEQRKGQAEIMDIVLVENALRR